MDLVFEVEKSSYIGAVKMNRICEEITTNNVIEK
jgi:hypothetical protein